MARILWRTSTRVRITMARILWRTHQPRLGATTGPRLTIPRRPRRKLRDTPVAGRRRNGAHTGAPQPLHPRTSASRDPTHRTTRPCCVLDPQATGATRALRAARTPTGQTRRLGRAAPTRTTTHNRVPAQRSARSLPGKTTRLARAVPLQMTPDIPATREMPDVVNRMWRRHTAFDGATPPTRPAARATSLSP